MNTKAHIILKLGVAFAFLYSAVSSLVDPSAWIGFAPQWIEIVLPKELFLMFFSLFEIALAGALLILKRPFYPAILAAATLFGIVLFNIGALDIVFRDISIGLAALALAMMSK